MDITDRKLLNIIQGPFPLVEQPYLEIGRELDISEDEVLQRLAKLKQQNVLRQISSIFDTRRLGYKTTLVAMAFDPKALHKGALEINKHPGVSHNYAREGSYYNLWFTLAVPPDHDLETTVQVMAQKTKAINVRIMPTIRFFKIGVNFDMVKQKGSSFNYSPDGYDKEAAQSWNQAQTVTEEEKEIIREMQEDLPLVSRPFDPIADKLGMTTAQLFQQAADFQERRFNAPLQRRAAPPAVRIPGQCNDRLEGAARTVGRSGHDHGAAHRSDPLLRTPHLPGLALYPLHDGPCHRSGRMRSNRERNRRRNRHRGSAAPLQHPGI